MPVGIFDALTVAVGAVSYALGRSRGFAWQLSGLVTLALGGASATILSAPLATAFGGGILGRFAAWVVVYAVVAICLYVLTLRFKHKLEELEFDELDRRFGGLLGALKGLLAFGVVTLIAVPLSPGVERAVKASACGRGLRAVVHELRAILPERIHEAFGPYLFDPVDPPAVGPEPTASQAATQPDPGPLATPTPTRPAVTPTAPATPARLAPSPSPARRPPPGPPPSPSPSPTTPPGPDPFDPNRAPPDPLAPR